MDPIAWDIRYRLAEKEHKKYLKFISQWWQLREIVNLDPLATSVPPDKLELAYVERTEVEEQIYQQGCMVIVGAKGSGKTALWQKYRSAKDTSGQDISFLRISPDVLVSACLTRHQSVKRSKILIDGTEHLNEQSISNLILTIQQWHTMTSGLLEFTVFIDQERKDLITGLDSVKQNTFAIYELPPWKKPELQALLGLRLAAWRPDFVDYNSFIRKIPGIPADVLSGLRNTLQNCKQFDSDADLRAVFVDDRITLWRSGLPEASDQEARIQQTVAYLWKCENTKHENGLILFLYALSDLVDFNDIRKQQLVKLAKDLESIWQPSRLSPIPPTSSDYTLNWAMSIPGLEDDEAKREFISMIVGAPCAPHPSKEA